MLKKYKGKQKNCSKTWKLKSMRIKGQIEKLMKEEYSGFAPFYDNNILKPV